MPSPPVDVPPFLDANLAALRAFQPDVARRIEAAIPPEHEPATGRDGTPTWRTRESPDKRWRWFGGSSMPRVSAEALADGATAPSGNFVIPGILTGMEAPVLAERRAAHVAFFIVEPDAAALQLALRLRDYVPLIRSGRLVLLLGEDAGETLPRFLAAHDGYEMPAHVLRAPQVSTTAFDALQRSLESAAREHARYVSETYAAMTPRLLSTFAYADERPATRGNADPAWVILGADPAPAVIERARQMARALGRLGRRNELCVPDRPAHAHTLARLRTVERIRPDAVCILGACPPALRAMLPPGLPVVSWLMDATPGPKAPGLEEPESERFVGPHDLTITTHHAGGTAHDASATQRCLDPGVNTDFYVPPPSAHPTTFDALLLFDLPRYDAAYCGLSLHSHVQLHGALLNLLDEDIDAYRYETADRFLREAERRCDVEVQDADLRANFIRLLRNVLAPARKIRAVVMALKEMNLRLAARGFGWPDDDSSGIPGRTMPTDPGERRDLFHATRAVVMDSPTWPGTETALQAAACGVQVVCRGSAEPFAADSPHLADVAACFHFYNGIDAAVQAVSNALDDAAQPVPRHVIENHDMTQRWRCVETWLEPA